MHSKLIETSFIFFLILFFLKICKIMSVVKAFKSQFYSLSRYLLYSQQIQKPSVSLVLAWNYFFQSTLLGSILNLALAIITWIAVIILRRLMNKHLAEFWYDQLLFRRQKTDYGTHLKAFAFDKFEQVELLKNFFLCSFKKFVSLRLPTPLNKALTEANRSKRLINIKVFN